MEIENEIFLLSNMLNAIFDALFEVFVKILFIFPGAFIRWIFKGFKGSYKEITESSDWEVNALIGIAVIGGIILLIVNV
ncbi:MAG: hypothetical protein QM768_00085 [Agriterribacter sp.]